MAHPNDASMTDELIGPTAFGKYTIFARLGSGGMADAVLAMMHGELGFQKLVVLKRMHSSLGRDPHFVRMFLDEARLAARLNHPNVVATSEVGEIDGQYFIAMEYLEGLSLDRIIRKYIQLGGGIPLAFLLRVLCDALEGLQHAHELRDFSGQFLGVVHRDVTPSNLFVTTDGMAKVLDFGIAKAATQDEATRTGMLKGKLAYMAPEQFYTDPIDRRSDLWSMGVLLWEMVTGRRLFKGSNDAVTYQNIVGMTVPPVGEFRPDAPADLDGVIRTALQRDRGQRYPDAESMRRDLEAILQGRLGGLARSDVGALMRTTFGDVIEENRETIRAFANPMNGGAPPGPLPMSAALRSGGGLTVPPTSTRVDIPRRLNQDAREVGGATLTDAMAPAVGFATEVDAPTMRRADAQSSAPPPAVVPAQPPPRLAATPQFGTPQQPEPRAPAPPVYVSPAAPRVALQPAPEAVFPPLGAESASPQRPTVMLPPKPKQGRAESALGWIILLGLVTVLSAGIYSRWEWIASAGRALLRNEPAPATYVGVFRLRITSEPNHARVLEGGQEIGATPLELTIHRAQVVDHPRQFVLQLPGHHPVAVLQSNTLRPEAEVHVTLPLLGR